MAESIISNEKRCYVCHTQYMLARHHIYAGVGRRSNAEKYGCWVYLCATHHNMSDYGVHFNKTLDLDLKKLCQERWEETYGTREEFREVFGKSYL